MERCDETGREVLRGLHCRLQSHEVNLLTVSLVCAQDAASLVQRTTAEVFARLPLRLAAVGGIAFVSADNGRHLIVVVCGEVDDLQHLLGYARAAC